MLIRVVGDQGSDAGDFERELAEQELGWQVEWVPLADAVPSLQRDPQPDVIVCVPELGWGRSLALLAQVREQAPHAVRILLMDTGQDYDAMTALDVAHRVLPGPLDSLPLIEAVESVMELRTLLDDPNLKQSIDRIGALPAAPRQYLALTRLLRDPDVSAARVSELVSQDPTVAAKVLRLSNSAYYSGGREISDLRAAVTRLGQNALRQLVLACEVFAAGADADVIRDRALRISNLSGQLLAGPSSELAQTAGLLAQVGLLLPPLLDEHGASTSPHGVAGAYLLGLWGLPTPIVEAVAFHQSPTRATGGFWVTGAVHVASALVNGVDVDEEYLRTVGALDRLPRWKQMYDTLEDVA